MRNRETGDVMVKRLKRFQKPSLLTVNANSLSIMVARRALDTASCCGPLAGSAPRRRATIPPHVFPVKTQEDPRKHQCGKQLPRAFLVERTPCITNFTECRNAEEHAPFP